MTEARELLRQYAGSGSDSAFSELVQRYINLVYSVAIRRVDGDAAMAQDITQTVFTQLAQKAKGLPANVMLGGWLHRHTCFAASTLLRGERRRHDREQQAVEMNMLNNSSETIWKSLAPVLDEALDELPALDRDALVLRYFEQRDLRAVGIAMGTNEDAAQKRVSRAVEKLRDLLANKGVALSAVALGTLLAAHAIVAAPAGSASLVSGKALATAASAGAGISLLGLNAKVALSIAALA
ncbi:MAG TPA: sigma-70 family RNA polymerase sigma factor, partial [Candidatus Dormibacteraeota bacterium]|nr:sigma-70 family RNA polymerase sigma factor [Candidatus Dormibacteraeota bacterium]